MKDLQLIPVFPLEMFQHLSSCRLMTFAMARWIRIVHRDTLCFFSNKLIKYCILISQMIVEGCLFVFDH